MISRAVPTDSFLSLSSSSELQPAPRGQSGFRGFPAVLEGIGQAAQGAEFFVPADEVPLESGPIISEIIEETPAKAGRPFVPGMALPDIDLSGKKLPPVLPLPLEGGLANAVDGPGPADLPEGSDGDAGLAEDQATAPLIQFVLVQPIPSAAPGKTAREAPTGSAATSPQQLVFAPRSVPGKGGESTPTAAPSPPSDVASVSLSVASAALTASESDDGDLPTQGALRRQVSYGPKSSELPAQPESGRAAPINAGAFALENSGPAAPAPRGDAARHVARPDAMQDLARIVDRLAAAREAFAPTGASLAIHHADFGEISLRFDQNRGGHIAVQLAARDAEAHSAIVSAVGQSHFQSLPDNANGSGQSNAQPQTQTQGQQQGRGNAAERENGSSGNSSARQDHQQHQNSPANSGNARKGGQNQAGIFA